MIMHFVPDDGGKIEFLRAIASHLKSGAPFVLMDANGDLNARESELMIEAWKQQQDLAGVKSDEVESGMKERVKAIHLYLPSASRNCWTRPGFIGFNVSFRISFWAVG